MPEKKKAAPKAEKKEAPKVEKKAAVKSDRMDFSSDTKFKASTKVLIQDSALANGKFFMQNPQGCIQFDKEGQAVVPGDIAAAIRSFRPSVLIVKEL